MKALVFDRKVAKYAAAAVAGRLIPGRGAKHGPLSLDDIDAPAPPANGWVRFKPRLSGICGSDLATIDGQSSRYFEPIVSFPFVLGHEVVGDVVGGAHDGSRAVLIPVLHCATRGIEPACDPCRRGQINWCERIGFGHLEPGLQSGFCESTGGGWSTAMVAHESQLFPIPADLSDEDAVLIEPAACAVHAAALLTDDVRAQGDIAIIGAGTLGLLTLAALRRFGSNRGPIAITAKYSEQRRLAKELGADKVVEPGELHRAVRLQSSSFMYGDQLSCGVCGVIDCVGSEASLTQALQVVAPGRTVFVVGMPGKTTLDLTSLWHRETALKGCYAYTRDDFDKAATLVTELKLGRLLSATYPLARYEHAIEHAANAGPRGAVKIAFDLRKEKERDEF